MPLDDSGAQEKRQRAIEAVMAKVRETLPQLADSMMNHVLTHTPDKDAEYDALMRGDGNPSGVDLTPRSGDRSGDTDGRVRLQKQAGTWLQDVNSAPGNIYINEAGMAVSIGNLPRLMEATHWTYKNIKYGFHRDYGPYFNAFEYGSSDVEAYITPRWSPLHGGKYPLRPDETGDPKIFGMYKPIKPRAMYAPFYLKPIARNTLNKSLAEVSEGHPNLT